MFYKDPEQLGKDCAENGVLKHPHTWARIAGRMAGTPSPSPVVLEEHSVALEPEVCLGVLQEPPTPDAGTATCGTAALLSFWYLRISRRVK